MSNSLAIAAVTSTLQAILHSAVSDLPGTKVTILPLDKARGTIGGHQLNLFLYQVTRNAAWANMDMPRQVQPGETGFPPLPLNLYYLLTAFGQDDDASLPFGHVLLGKGMSAFYDHPVLSAQDIRAAVSVAPDPLPQSDLDQQIEHVRIRLHPIEDLSKLWTGFATQYRLSVAYEVAVALIESTRAARAPLPVLARGPGDRGVASQADVIPPLPALEAVTPPGNQPSARLGDVVTLTGFHLDGAKVRVQFQHSLLPAPNELAAPGGTDKEISVTIPDDHPADWPAGFYIVTVLVRRSGEDFDRSTNQLPLALAPAITIAPASTSAGDITFTVTSAPQVWLEQRPTLLLGEREILAGSRKGKTDTLNFTVSKLAAGIYRPRLRIDGVDSQLVDRTASPPVFLDTKVTVT